VQPESFFMTYQKVSASGLILSQDGKVLMVKRAETDDFLPGVYELPGGGTEFMEDPIEGLEREIAEECGLRVKVSHPLTAFSFKMNHEGVEKHTVEIIYLCEVEGDPAIKLSFEHSDFKWMSFEEIIQTPDNEYFTKMMSDLQKHPLVATTIQTH
jgi:8-oxo-dGTP diphosphatase